MMLIADESVDFPFIEALRTAGHDTIAVAEFASGSADEDVLAMAVQDARLLVTMDKDFGELVFRLQHRHSGILLLRFPPIDHEHLCQIVVDCLNKHELELASSFSVLTLDLLRVRKVT